MTLALTATLLVGLAGLALACRARFSNAPCYLGPPTPALTKAYLQAGGAPGRFSTLRFLRVISFGHPAPILAQLRTKFGSAVVATFVKASNFAAADSRAIARKAHVVLPARPAVSPTDGRALYAALHRAGSYPRGHHFDVEYMLDHLVGHATHALVMDDIDSTLGHRADAIYHIVFDAMMHDVGAQQRVHGK